MDHSDSAKNKQKCHTELVSGAPNAEIPNQVRDDSALSYGQHHNSGTIVPQKYIKLTEECLISCVNDIRYDRDYSKVFFETYSQLTFREMLHYLEIPAKYHDELRTIVTCPQCGAPIGLDDYVIADLSEMEHILYKRKFGYISRQTKNEIDRFYTFLSKYPYLGAEHETGRKISAAIAHYDKLISLENVILYRARNISSDKQFAQSDMTAPNPMKHTIYEGRYNHFGQSHLYMSYSEETAQLESCKSVNAVCWIQQIRINRLERVLDLNRLPSDSSQNESELLIEGLLINRTLTKKAQKNRSWKPQYFVTRFIADLCKMNSISAIIYPSSQSADSNIVIFEPDKLDCTFVGQPYLYSVNAVDKRMEFGSNS